MPPIHPVFPFAAWQSCPRIMPDAHAHTDLELNFFTSGSARYFLAGRFWDVPTETLAVFWAGLPHHIVALSPGSKYLCMTLPLAWFLNWKIGDGLTSRLMAGELVTEPDTNAGPWDARLFSRWANELTRSGGTPFTRRVALLEVEARLRRLTPLVSPLFEAGKEGRGDALQRIADYLSRHYQDPDLSVQMVARAVDLHPNYVQTAFKTGCGLPVWEYLVRLRVSHAQRLLLTTDWTMERVAHECGFGSSSRFFAAFKARCSGTPRQYRLHGGGSGGIESTTG